MLNGSAATEAQRKQSYSLKGWSKLHVSTAVRGGTVSLSARGRTAGTSTLQTQWLKECRLEKAEELVMKVLVLWFSAGKQWNAASCCPERRTSGFSGFWWGMEHGAATLQTVLQKKLNLKLLVSQSIYVPTCTYGHELEVSGLSRSCWSDFITHLIWERIWILQEELDVWNALLNLMDGSKHAPCFLLWCWVLIKDIFWHVMKLDVWFLVCLNWGSFLLLIDFSLQRLCSDLDKLFTKPAHQTFLSYFLQIKLLKLFLTSI